MPATRSSARPGWPTIRRYRSCRAGCSGAGCRPAVTGEPRETWLLEDAAGVGGWYLLELPDRDNGHLSFLEIQVAPGRRRNGLGTALLRHAAGPGDRRRAPTAERVRLRRLGGRGVRPGVRGGRGTERDPARDGHRGPLDRTGWPTCGTRPGRPRPGTRWSAGPDRRQRSTWTRWPRSTARAKTRRAMRAIEEPRVGRGAGPRNRPAGAAARHAGVHRDRAPRRHRRAGGADRGRGRPGTPGMGVPGADRGGQGAPRPPARAAAQAGHARAAGAARSRR